MLIITSLEISSCNSVRLEDLDIYFTDLTKIRIKNVKNMTEFKPKLLSQELDSIELKNIGYIPDIIHEDTFPALTGSSSMNRFEIEKTTIGTFDVTFHETILKTVILRDVCIQNLKGLDEPWSKTGGTLEIIDCCIVITKMPVYLEEFQNITITGSTFEFKETTEDKGNMSMRLLMIRGDSIKLLNNNFINVSINVMGNISVDVRNTRGTGRSNMRLNSNNITSYENKLAGNITYVSKNSVVQHGNGVCSGGKCECHSHMACRRKYDAFNDSPKDGIDTHSTAKTVHPENVRVCFLALTTVFTTFMVTKM